MSKKTKKDPSGQQSNRNRGTRALHSRINDAEKKVKTLFRLVPKSFRQKTKIVNAERTTVYDYEYDQEQMAANINYIVNDYLLETQTGVMPFNWYWTDNLEQSYRQGTVEEVRDFNQLIAGAVISGVLVRGLAPRSVPVNQVLFSEAYRKALNNTYVSAFTDIKSLSDATSAQVIRQINLGMQSGKTPTEVTALISKRFDVSRSDAKRIADTEINKAYNDGKMNANSLLAAETGMRSAVIHVSALTSTTRSSHADRHGNAYTVEDQMQWWDSGSNRINCKCSIKTALISRGGALLDPEMQEKIKAERSFFDE